MYIIPIPMDDLSSSRRFPTLRLRFALILYSVLWILGLPLMLAYLWHRARSDPLYGQHLAERFGVHKPWLPGSVWIHAVSLGEVRSAVPLIKALLAEGRSVVISHFTPAGRREVERVFAKDIADGRLRAVWVPFEFEWTFRRFFGAFRPAYGLVMEVEIWPRMIMASRRAKVPLLLCNAQYPLKSYTRDTGRPFFAGARADLIRGFAGAMVKSGIQKERFASVGAARIAVTGELRFEQPIPSEQVRAGHRLRQTLAPDRTGILFASVVEGEDPLFIRTILDMRRSCSDEGLSPPLFVYVPRAPERFGEVAALLDEAGCSVLRRSEALDEKLAPKGDLVKTDLFLGDSMGEMNAYIAMCDRVVVGGGFTPKGSHGITEALAQGKPVIVGPETWTIEYPAEEAIRAGVCRRVSPECLADALAPGSEVPERAAIQKFLSDHSGALEKTLASIPMLLGDTTDRLR